MVIMNIKKTVKDLDGNDIKGISVGKAIASILASEKTADPLRSFALAQKFYTEEDIELDASEKEYVTQLVTSNNSFSPLVTGQLIMALKETK